LSTPPNQHITMIMDHVTEMAAENVALPSQNSYILRLIFKCNNISQYYCLVKKMQPCIWVYERLLSYK